jgi:L-serine dehydratase
VIKSFAEWFEAAESREQDLAEVVERREVKETGVPREAVRKRISETLGVMRHAIDEGLQREQASPSGLTGGRSGKLAADGPRLLGDDFTAMLSRAIATLETNARMGVIMAAPTAGAAGVVPAALLTLAPARGWSEGPGSSSRNARRSPEREVDARRRPAAPPPWRQPP